MRPQRILAYAEGAAEGGALSIFEAFYREVPRAPLSVECFFPGKTSLGHISRILFFEQICNSPRILYNCPLSDRTGTQKKRSCLFHNSRNDVFPIRSRLFFPFIYFTAGEMNLLQELFYASNHFDDQCQAPNRAFYDFPSML